MPETPGGFRVTLIGADLEQVIGSDGRIYDTIQDKEVTVGYFVEDTRGREEAREVSFKVAVPAANGSSATAEEAGNGSSVTAEEAGNGSSDAAGGAGQDGDEINDSPYWIVPSIAEWRGGRGIFNLASEERLRIVVDTDSRPPQKDKKAAAGTDAHAAEADVQTGRAENADAQALWEAASLFGKQCENSRFQYEADVCEGTLEDVGTGDI